MTNSKNSSFKISGFLLENPHSYITRSDLLRCDKLQFVTTVQGTRWEKFTFFSDIPLKGEDIENINVPFKYHVFCRRSGPRVLFLSTSRDLANYIIDNYLSGIFTPPLRRLTIAVDDLVKALIDKPTKYLLSFVYARSPAFGSALRALSFFGDDLAEASLFRDCSHLLNYYSCGLRSSVGGSEIIRIGAEGFISFYMSGSNRIIEVETALSFLRDGGYLPDMMLSD